MIFINSDVQTAFFNLLCSRRGKRLGYGAATHTLMWRRAFFDRCIIMIASHHPHIWTYGTGNLLVAPPLPTPETLTKAEERAIEWRLEALREHDSDGIVDEGFGYFIRYTLECRKRLSIYMIRLELQQESAVKMFEYIDRAAPQLNDLISNIENVDRRGKARYGEDKFNEGKLTTGKTDHNIMIECNWRPNIKVLREFMVDIIEPEFVTETISTLVIPTAFVYADTEKKCVVCLEKKDVLMWPCYHSHVTCVECTIELSYVRFSCPICRASVDYKYGKWYMRRPTLE